MARRHSPAILSLTLIPCSSSPNESARHLFLAIGSIVRSAVASKGAQAVYRGRARRARHNKVGHRAVSEPAVAT